MDERAGQCAHPHPVHFDYDHDLNTAAMALIHPALKKAQVASRYYAIVHPDRNYPMQQALRQFRQDRSIDKKILRAVIESIFAEQKKML